MGEDATTPTTTVGTFWARVEYLTGRELEAMQQRWADARYRICMLRQPGITLQAKDTITWNSQTLDILNIQGQGTRMPEWTIIARDFVA
jgi:head-tail adaptor